MIAVRFIDDKILYSCSINNLTNKNAKIGSVNEIQWIDGYMYKARLLKKSGKYIFL